MPNAGPDLPISSVDTPEQVVGAITQLFQQHSGDEDYREGMARVVPGARPVYGVRVPKLRKLARQVINVFPSGEVAEAIAEGCWQGGSRAHSVLAILILAGMKGLTSQERWEWGSRYLPEVGDWETCDQLCMGLLGQALADNPSYMEELEGWVEHPNLWVRRAALASSVVLRRSKAAGEIRRSLDQRTLGMCLSLLDDEEHYVRKAVDWAVREVIRRDYDVGQAWMMERAKGSLSRVAQSTLKKAAKKLSPEDQEQFLKTLSE